MNSNGRAHNRGVSEEARLFRQPAQWIPRRDEGGLRGADDKERKVRVGRKFEHLNVHVLNWSQVADRDPSESVALRQGTAPADLTMLKTKLSPAAALRAELSRSSRGRP